MFNVYAKATKELDLLSLKQRTQLIAYYQDKDAREWPRLPAIVRCDTPWPSPINSPRSKPNGS